MRLRVCSATALLALAACGGSHGAGSDDAWSVSRAEPGGTSAVGPPELAHIPIGAPTAPTEDEGSAPLRLTARGRPTVPPLVPQPADPSLFRNTYYDFPTDDGGRTEATLYDAACRPLARVSRDFHDHVCVQGSGRLASGATVSFAKRGCDCADICPRTGQQICFERLDPARFPNGRGAMGRAITPLYTIAVDSSLIPLGSSVFVPELVGLPRLDGAPHDGCFVAEDRGVRVIGRQIDVFTGDPAVTKRWNAMYPSNRGVHVVIGDPRCAKGQASL